MRNKRAVFWSMVGLFLCAALLLFTCQDTATAQATDTPTPTPTQTSTPAPLFYSTLESGQAVAVDFRISAGETVIAALLFVIVLQMFFVVGWLAIRGNR